MTQETCDYQTAEREHYCCHLQLFGRLIAKYAGFKPGESCVYVTDFIDAAEATAGDGLSLMRWW